MSPDQSADQPDLHRTPLHDAHVALGATMVGFAGWSMPVKYTSDVAEHTAVRTAVGLFDISHMAQITVTGPDAAAFLDHALAGRISTLAPLQSRYTMILADSGGIIDDLIVTNTHLPADAGTPPSDAGTGQATEAATDPATHGAAEPAPPTEFLVVANAANRDPVLAALQERLLTRSGADDSAPGDTGAVTIADTHRALVAVQGPHAVAVLHGLAAAGDLVVNPGHALAPDGTEITLDTLRYYRTVPATFRDAPVTLSRTGYTGEDGFELSIAPLQAGDLWEALLAVGQAHGIVPAGLAARDTLRLEAGMPLYGHELTLDTLPVQAGLGRVVATAKDDFVGKAGVEAGPAADAPVLVGLTLPGRRAGRADYRVLDGEGTDVGVVTSGVLSPTLGHPIAMAYVRPDLSAPGTVLAVDVRGTAIPATVVELPFYRRSKES
ncbi:aminomethyltransferase family protein [Miniimonas sp. S16]|uniref:aminomethyltransferase family protein n=1 Tax=Miniimonas sp. S16 TaxID=2171623 RepID=UPI000D527012|nr:glycine cleavage system aminomethyltransferase GcvT [Miniimonas sp. S16]